MKRILKNEEGDIIEIYEVKGRYFQWIIELNGERRVLEYKNYDLLWLNAQYKEITKPKCPNCGKHSVIQGTCTDYICENCNECFD